MPTRSRLPADLTPAVEAVRRFNRFYTRQVGVLDEAHLRSPFPLAAVRVLYEIAHRPEPSAAAIGRELRVDPGYLSRLLRDLDGRGLLTRRAAPGDARQQTLALTPAGRQTLGDLEARARGHVAAMLAGLDPTDRARLLDALGTVESLLGRAPEPDATAGATPNDTRRAAPNGLPGESADAASAVVLRDLAPGDLGWVVERHGALYDAEYGWGARFEALVARVAADFAESHDPARERGWIAELGGERVGSVFLVRHPEREGVAKFRLLLVEPRARGRGVGARLVGATTAFARAAGYHTVTLWTNSVLTPAIRLYQAAGYRLVHEAPHDQFGHALVGQTWELTL